MQNFVLLIVSKPLHACFDAEEVQCADVRKPCIGELCYDFAPLEQYLNQPAVQAKLGVHRRCVQLAAMTEVPRVC